MKNMKNMKNRKKLTMLSLVAALGIAVYLNWEYAKTEPVPAAEPDISVSVQKSGVEKESKPVMEPVSLAEDQQAEEVGNKNYGDAQLVSVGKSSSAEYFEKADLNRKKSRDESLDMLQKSLKGSKLTDEEKEKITGELSEELGHITEEGNIENMVKAKGFENCLASVDQESVHLTVSTGGEMLTAAQASQLRDIVLSQTDVEAKNITIVEVK